MDINRLNKELKGKKYELKNRIGEGTTAVTYKIYDPESGAEYACKVSEHTGLLQKESELLRQTEHPLFPAWKQYLEISGFGFLIMEYIHGKNLQEYLDQRGRMTVMTTVRIAMEISDGLGYLHERKQPVYYRDLKPEHIIIQPDARIRVLDLGAAGIKEGWKAGTIGYAAPEILGVGDVFPCSDVYTLGKVIHYMITGKNPCLGKKPLLPAGTFQPRIPRGMDDIIRRCIADDPKERIPGMRELRKELSSYYGKDRTVSSWRNIAAAFPIQHRRQPVYEKNIWMSIYKDIL